MAPCAPVSQAVEDQGLAVGLERRLRAGLRSSGMPATTPATQDEQGRPDHEGVVPLVGGNREENRRVKAEKSLPSSQMVRDAKLRELQGGPVQILPHDIFQRSTRDVGVRPSGRCSRASAEAQRYGGSSHCDRHQSGQEQRSKGTATRCGGASRPRKAVCCSHADSACQRSVGSAH